MAWHSAVSWELLRRSARRVLRAQFRLLVLGLAGPLALCLWTMLRHFELRAGYHNLLQCAIWLAGWYIVFAELGAVLLWLRPPASARDDDTRHLPLSQLHFLLVRASELCLVPLAAFVLTLPAWLAVLLYSGLPYGEQWSAGEWVFTRSDQLFTLWPARLACISLALLGATLLPGAFSLLLHESLRWPMLRVLVLLGVTTGMYFVARELEYSYLRLCYRQTRGYDALSFLLPVVLWLLLVFCAGLLSPRWRVTLAVLAICAAALFFALPKLHRDAFPWAAPLRAALNLHDVRMGLAYCAGHLSPPRNLRLLADSLHSNVLLSGGPAPIEPDYPDWDLHDQDPAAFEQARREYEAEYAQYAQAYSRLPRLPMLYGAALYPLLLAGLATGGLLLGAALRRAPPREDM